jgi:hypothetical protein
MSAQIIAALRRRAAELKQEAHTLQLGGEVPPGPQGRPRHPEHLLLIADEFRALAKLAEGFSGEGAGDGSDSG